MRSTRNYCNTWGQIKLEISQHTFEKQSKIKFQENSSNGSRVFLRGTDEGWADITRITVAFHSFVVNVSNNKSLRLQGTFLTIQGYVFISRNLTRRCTLLISKLQCHNNETFFWSAKFALTCLGNAFVLCPYVCSLMVDKTELIGWDCALLAGNQWQLNEMLEAPFLHM